MALGKPCGNGIIVPAIIYLGGRRPISVRCASRLCPVHATSDRERTEHRRAPLDSHSTNCPTTRHTSSTATSYAYSRRITSLPGVDPGFAKEGEPDHTVSYHIVS